MIEEPPAECVSISPDRQSGAIACTARAMKPSSNANLLKVRRKCWIELAVTFRFSRNRMALAIRLRGRNAAYRLFHGQFGGADLLGARLLHEKKQGQERQTDPKHQQEVIGIGRESRMILHLRIGALDAEWRRGTKKQAGGAG